MSTHTSSVSRVVVVFARACVARIRHSPSRAAPSLRAIFLHRITHQSPMYHHCIHMHFSASSISRYGRTYLPSAPVLVHASSRLLPRARRVASRLRVRIHRSSSSSSKSKSYLILRAVPPRARGASLTRRPARALSLSPRLPASIRAHAGRRRPHLARHHLAPRHAPVASPRARRTAPPSVDDDDDAPGAREGNRNHPGCGGCPQTPTPGVDMEVDRRVWRFVCEGGSTTGRDRSQWRGGKKTLARARRNASFERATTGRRMSTRETSTAVRCPRWTSRRRFARVGARMEADRRRRRRCGARPRRTRAREGATRAKARASASERERAREEDG